MDIEIFPHRLLSADTTEKLLNDLEELEGVKKMVMEGETDTKVMTQLQACISSMESLKVEMIKQEMKQSLVEDVKKSLGLS